jgi:preprotein translocase SecE subunit
MAMAVAVKDTPEAASRQLNRLAIGSLAGTVYILASIAAAFYAIPQLWAMTLSRIIAGGQKSVVDEALLMLVVLAAIAGLVALGRKLIGTNPPHGMRAGIFVGVFAVLVIGLVTRAIGGLLEAAFGSESALGAGLALAVGVVLLGALASAYFRPRFDDALVRIEDQGWFTIAAYKKNQGQRVRRGTMLAILVLAGCGIYTLLAHDTLRTGAPNWEVALPFTGGKTLVLLPNVQFTLPALVCAAALWFAYRIVNFPAFADFLIATEAELNKVSWTTRKRLIQDTIVVLTTVFLFTLFLFIVDIFWVNLLSSRWIQVLQTSQSTQEKQANPDEW